MILVSSRTQYGLQALLEIARYGGDAPLQLRAIAKAQRISAKYLHTVLKTLCDAGILESTRGARGGYLLRRQPDSVSLRELVEVLERPRLRRRVAPRGDARLVTDWLAERHAEVGELLDHHTLADLLARALAAPAQMYFI